MAGYVYRCPRCGPWEVRRPIGTAESSGRCPGCGAEGRRVYTAPLLSRTAAPVAAARLREEASGDAPTVTTTVPRAAGRPAPRDPRWDALPRP
ncbi:FmdB family zinc ribbon protein [Geodermatophilus sabuli]|uniref:Putative regulatory protein, FmdB family n=1 Tax=Geodermatophilus sabuli TaxID=1564158 RepID=A0A285EA73_9ACTN|nr:zinc ribbon domain-containing protein [Geodermatophilus sabuli]MBB3085711.1 putative FmdB family regulatory protein [Geodermatophilus sabuli]SNX95870.1 putative regulatory protein, FmdB family [Geodermatophilus sabuli]